MSSSGSWSFSLYSRGQQIVLAVLVGLCVLIMLLLKFYEPEPPYYAGDPELQAALARLHPAVDRELATAIAPKSANFTFNPNTVSQAELQQLGLSEKQATSWIKYRAGQTNRFKQPADIARLYVLKPEDVKRLLPLVKMDADAAGSATTAPTIVADKAPERFPFDPNTVNEADLQRLGLSAKQAKSFIKYRDRRNKPFQTADELDKIRILKDDQKVHLKELAVIEPMAFVQQDDNAIEPTTENQVTEAATRQGPTTYGSTVAPPVAYASPEFTLDINEATALDLEQLPGIGPFWAKRLLEFREKLGGFSSLQQVSTTYGFPDSTYQRILPYLENPGPVYRKITINLLTKEELKEHVYINYKLADIIVKFREQHGPFNSIEDVRRIRLFNQQLEEKLAPYLDFSTE